MEAYIAPVEELHKRQRVSGMRRETCRSLWSTEKPSQGEVIAVGPGGRDESGKLIPIDVQVGDRVLFGKWSGTEVKIDGQDLLIMKESDIMGVLEAPASKKKAA
jgi:co-chaperonin GroES (HSP10)